MLTISKNKVSFLESFRWNTKPDKLGRSKLKERGQMRLRRQEDQTSLEHGTGMSNVQHLNESIIKSLKELSLNQVDNNETTMTDIVRKS